MGSMVAITSSGLGRLVTTVFVDRLISCFSFLASKFSHTGNAFCEINGGVVGEARLLPQGGKLMTGKTSGAGLKNTFTFTRPSGVGNRLEVLIPATFINPTQVAALT